MMKGQPKKGKLPKEKTIKKDLSFVETIKPGSAIPDRLTKELLLLKKSELKKVSGKLLDFKHLRIDDMDDAGKFCIWVEFEDMKNPAKKYKPIRLVPHVAPFALNKLTGYFEHSGNAVVIDVLQTQKVFLTFAPILKKYKTRIRSCIVTFIKSTPL